jgi:arylsulfatase A-like enzyme
VTGFEDWMPTLMALVGAAEQTPAGLDGISFAPTLLGEKQPEREFLSREFLGYGGQQSLRMGNWKLIKIGLMGKGKKAGPKGDAIQLYDLATDPKETHNVAGQHPEILAKMETHLKSQHAASADFPFPVLDR